MSCRWFRLVPMMCVMGTIFFLSHKTGDEIKLPEIKGIDLVAHAMIYGALACSFLFALNAPWKYKFSWRAALATVLFCLVYGISDEFHQSFVPGRFVSILDVVADTVGAFLVCSFWLVKTKNRPVSATLS